MERQIDIPGKLMITGEYAVLKGAKSLAIPTSYQQHFSFSEEGSTIHWESFDHNNESWFSCEFGTTDLTTLHSTDEAVSLRLQLLLQHCLNQNPKLRKPWKIQTHLDFDRSWGLGSSSTLIAALSEWAGEDFMPLLRTSFSGSGYDVAVGLEKAPIVYHLENDEPSYERVSFQPPFKKNLHFIHLGNKQNSERELSVKRGSWHESDLKQISRITNELLVVKELSDFEKLMTEHEAIVGSYLNRPTIKDLRFQDYSHLVSSLGAWGGDFVLAVGSESDMDYFRDRGYSVIISFDDMIYTSEKNG